jgi:hypothetical protein
MGIRQVDNYPKINPLVWHASRRGPEDRNSEQGFDPKELFLWTNNPQTIYCVESATLTQGHGDPVSQKYINGDHL